MKHVSILVPECSVMQAIADPNYCLSAVNQFLVQSGNPAAFHLQLVGATREVRLANGAFSVYPNAVFPEVEHTDLIIIPAVFGDMETAIAANPELIEWVKGQFQKGAKVASLCVGAFLLAETGLLDGRKCSTHWGFIGQFKSRFPKVEVLEGQIVTEERGLYSSGGANSYWNLLLYLVEKFASREMAILAAKYFAIDIGRTSQLPFVLFQSQKNHSDEAVKKAQQLIEENFEEKLNVDHIAKTVALGRRSFERRFRQATKNSVLEYIRRVKVEVAKRNFETSQKNVAEVMSSVGYSDSRAFSATFKKLTGLSPSEYRNRYSKLN
jgi:transcriptional regulator GlxA family with amidase domain